MWNEYFYTAGHCINDAGGLTNNDPWRNGAGTIVWGKNKAAPLPDDWVNCGWFTNCNYGDQGLFGFGSSVPAQYNLYFIGSSTTVAINQRTQRFNQIVGQLLYRYEQTSGLDSGAISDKPEF